MYTLLRSRAPGVSLFNDLTNLEIDLELPPSNWELQTLGRGALHEKHNVSLVMRKLLAGISKSLGGISKSISKALGWDFQAILLKCFAYILGSGHMVRCFACSHSAPWQVSCLVGFPIQATMDHGLTRDLGDGRILMPGQILKPSGTTCETNYSLVVCPLGALDNAEIVLTYNEAGQDVCEIGLFFNADLVPWELRDNEPIWMSRGTLFDRLKAECMHAETTTKLGEAIAFLDSDPQDPQILSFSIVKIADN